MNIIEVMTAIKLYGKRFYRPVYSKEAFNIGPIDDRFYYHLNRDDLLADDYKEIE